MYQHLVNGEKPAFLNCNPDGTYTQVQPVVYLPLNRSATQSHGEDMVMHTMGKDDTEVNNNWNYSMFSHADVTISADGDGEANITTADQDIGFDAQYANLKYTQCHAISDVGATWLKYSASGVDFDAAGVTTPFSYDSDDAITYTCPTCEATFSNANGFTKHMQGKHFMKVYACRQCAKHFDSLSQLFLHARRSHVDAKQPRRDPSQYKYHCDKCDYMTNNGGTMQHHERAHTGEKPFVCDVCNKGFAQKSNMKVHRNRHIHRERIFKCETCVKAYTSYEVYLAHLRTREHELAERLAMTPCTRLTLECMGCSLAFHSIDSINRHSRGCAVIRSLQRKYRCVACNQYFSGLVALKGHVKLHGWRRIISCPVRCESGFPTMNHLNHHISRAHELKADRGHVCRYCESRFEETGDLDIHIRSMHAKERNARQSRGAVGRLKCCYAPCHFATNSIMLLDRHHGQHTDGRLPTAARIENAINMASKNQSNSEGVAVDTLSEISAGETGNMGESTQPSSNNQICPATQPTTVWRSARIRRRPISYRGYVTTDGESDEEMTDYSASSRTCALNTTTTTNASFNPYELSDQAVGPTPIDVDGLEPEQGGLQREYLEITVYEEE